MEDKRQESCMQDDQVTRLALLAVKLDLQKEIALDQPIAKYDPKTRKVYLEKSDGSREAVANRLRRGYFSERKKET